MINIDGWVKAIHVADWCTGKDYRVFRTEEEALEWIGQNCEDQGEDGLYYLGNRVELY